MNDADRKQFASAMLAMAEYYGKPMSKSILGLWWHALQGYDIAAIEEAVHTHMRSDQGEFMPKAAHLVKLIEGSTVDRALRAWAMVDKAVRRVGTYRSVVFDDPIIMRVIQDMGGWEKLGAAQESEWPFIAKEFENRYRGFAAQGVEPEHPPKLAGLFERENSHEGRPVEPPVLIGDRELAMQVLLSGSTAPLAISTTTADMARRIGHANAK